MNSGIPIRRSDGLANDGGPLPGVSNQTNKSHFRPTR